MEKALLKLVNSRVLFLFVMPLALYIALSHFMPLLEPNESRYFEISDNAESARMYPKKSSVKLLRGIMLHFKS